MDGRLGAAGSVAAGVPRCRGRQTAPCGCRSLHIDRCMCDQRDERGGEVFVMTGGNARRRRSTNWRRGEPPSSCVLAPSIHIAAALAVVAARNRFRAPLRAVADIPSARVRAGGNSEQRYCKSADNQIASVAALAIGSHARPSLPRTTTDRGELIRPA